MSQFPAPLDRSRILRRGGACAECRRRRTKCDGGRPVCSTCKDHGRICSHSLQDPPEEDEPRLQRRLRELESQVRAQERAVAPASGPRRTQSRRTAARAASVSHSHPYAPARASTSRMAPPPPPPPPPPVSPPIPVPPPPVGPFPSLVPSVPFEILAPWHPPPLNGLESPLPYFNSWRPDTEMSVSLRSQIIATFIHLQPQLNLDLHIPRLQKFIHCRPYDPEGCHPALWNAICLVVVSCYGPEADQLESIFLERLDHFRVPMFIGDIHEQCLEQYTLASTLEVWYMLRVGRLFDAQVRSAGLVRFVIGFGWHDIPDPVHYLYRHAHSPGNKTGTRDLYQVAERINLWWSVYVLAQRVAFASGSHDGCPDFPPEKIDTVLPWSWQHLESTGATGWGHRFRLQDFFAAKSSLLNMKDDSILTLSVKSLALYFRTTYVSKAVSENGLPMNPSPGFLHEFDTLRKISRQLLGSVPKIDNCEIRNTTSLLGTAVCEVASEPFSQRRRFKPSLVHVHVELLCSAMSLAATPFVASTEPTSSSDVNGMFAQIPSELEQMEDRLLAAQSLARIAGIITDVSSLYLQFPLGPPMLAAADLLVLEVRRGRYYRDATRIDTAGNHLKNVARLLRQLSAFFPEIENRLQVLHHLLNG